MPVVYLDMLVVLNWVIDFLLLSLTSCVLRLPSRRGRAVAGGLVGGIAACQLLWDIPAWLSLGIHGAVAALMIRIAFAWMGAKAFFRQTVTLFCMSALLSGLVGAFWYVTGSDVVATRNGVIYCDISPVGLTVLVLFSYGVIRVYERITSRRVPANLEYRLTFRDGGEEYECRALYDTGLHLRDPFSGAPVVVVWRAALPSLSVCERRRRMIPYRSLNGTGLLPAFRPERVTLHTGGRPPRDITGVYVALSDEPRRGEYAALVGSDITTE